MTLQTVADRVGVSRMTVSNAFSRPDQLSDDLRRKILAAADELGYAGPDPSARALAKGRTGSVGVMLTDSLEYAFTDQVATDLMAAITAELAPSGVALTLLTSREGDGWIPARDVPMDGAIVFSCAHDGTSVEWLRKRKLPMVFIDQYPVDDVTCINIDEHGGAFAAARHVIDLGHRRVAILAAGSVPIGIAPAGEDQHGKYTNRYRLQGWIDALEAAGIEPTVVRMNHGAAEAAEAAMTLLEMDPDHRPTAILCYSDTMATGVYQSARKLGIDIPSQLSVVGFDDARFAVAMDPPLTTVHQDIQARGHQAASALLAAIAAGGTEFPEQIVLPTNLVVRASTAPPVEPAAVTRR